MASNNYIKGFLRKLRRSEGPLAVVARGAGVALMLKGAGAGLTYLMEIVIARWLGADQYGQFTYALAWASVLGILATLGLHGGVLRFNPQYRVRSDWALMKGLMLRSWQLTLFAGSTVACMAILVITAWGGEIGLSNKQVLLLGMAIVPLEGLMVLQMGMGRSLESVTAAFTPKHIVKPVLVLGGIFLASELFGELNSEVALIVVLGVLIVLTTGQAGILWRIVPEQARLEKPSYRTRHWLRISFPLLLIYGFVILLNRTDLIMLGIMEESRHVGIYKASAQTAALVSLLLAAVNALAGPTISKLYHQERQEDLQRLATTVAQYVFWPSVVIGAVLIAMSGVILGLFGPEFTQGRPVLAILVVGQLVNAGVGSVGYFMNMTGHQDETAKVYGITVLLNGVLNGVMIPLFGVIGAAAATAMSMATWNVWLNRLVFKRLGIRTSFLSAW